MVTATPSAVRAAVTDAALAGAALGVVVGVASGASWGWLFLPLLAVLAAGAMLVLVPRRLTLRVDGDELRIGRLRSTDVIGWAQVQALGIMERPSGRSGRLWTVAVRVQAAEPPVTVPALSVRTPVLRRLGDQGQEDRTAEAVAQLLDPLLPLAAQHGVEILDIDPRDWSGS